MKPSLILSTIFCSLGFSAMAQEEVETLNPFSFSGYAEAYYNYDFNNPKNNTRPSFIYSHNRNNEVNINLAFIKGVYSTEKLRANLAIGTGTYLNANYAAENGVLKNMYEANVGVKISNKHNLWIDAGLMPSHIGFESAIGKDNLTLTRSIPAENSPYFETGAKISYTSPSEKWFLSALFLNGWQRIARVDGNSTMAFGHQITYKPTSKITINSSSFIGSDQPDETRAMRYFHDLYGQFQVNDQWQLIAAFDIGAQQKEKGSDAYNSWFAPIVIVKYKASEKVSLAARAEYYNDENGVIIAVEQPEGFKTFGYSLNLDYAITSNVMWRTELRSMNSENAIFEKRDDTFSDTNTLLSTALTFSF